jgi:cytochrome P450
MGDSIDYDPYDLDVRRDPYPYYRRLRDEAPAYYVEDHDFWVLSRRENVVAGVRDYDTFSSADGIAIERTPGMKIMIGSDPPYHTRVRRLVQREFTPRAVARWEPRIEQLADELFEELLERHAGGDADLTRDLATPLPVMVIAEILGIPVSERDQFKEWSEEVVYLIGGAIDPALQTASVNAALQLGAYFSSIVDERKKDPSGDDLVSLFVRAGEGEDGLTHEEIVTHCILFLIGGNETTTNLIGNTVRALIAHRDAERRLQEDRSVVPAAIEEVLRWDAPVQGLFRTTQRPVDIEGTVIPEGARVQLLYGSANRDERHYPEPDRFDIDRGVTDHLAFGGGVHLCIGAPLARMEAKHAITRIVQRLRNVELRAEPQLNFNILVRGPRSLPVDFEVVA